MEQSRIPLDLQYFAETAEGGSMDPEAGKLEMAVAGNEKDGAGDGAAEKEEKDVTEKTASGQEGKNAAGVAKESGKGQEDIAALVQEEIRKASMSPQEKEAYEKERKEKSLAEREDAISLRERQADAKELLADSGLPAEFRDMVMGKDRAATEANVKSFKVRFDAAVQAQVEVRLKGRTPYEGTGAAGGSAADTLMAQVEGYLS